MPVIPSAGASSDEIRSSQFVGSLPASSRATGSSQCVIGSQNGWNWIQPPSAASTVSTATGTSIVHGPSLP